MIEQYVINELNNLKEENSKLREELTKEQNKMIVSIDNPKVYKIELIEKESVIKKLEENGVDLIKLYDEEGTDRYFELIKDLKLYKDKFKQNDKVVAVVKFNNRYYEMTPYYNEYKLENEVYIDLDKAILNELVDELYDLLRDYKYQKQKEEKENNKDE